MSRLANAWQRSWVCQFLLISPNEALNECSEYIDQYAIFEHNMLRCSGSKSFAVRQLLEHSGSPKMSGRKSSIELSHEPLAPDIEVKLRKQVDRWKEKLLDLGNRNPLINCSLSPTRGAFEIVYPDCEAVWRKLVTESETETAAMRFPWRRDLVPPPPSHENSPHLNGTADKQELLIGEQATEVALGPDGKQLSERAPSLNPSSTSDSESDGLSPKKWNPPFTECRASSHLREMDLLTQNSDAVVDRRLRTFESHAQLSISEQGVHCLFVAFGFLKWFESVDSEKELLSPLMLVPVALSRASADSPWELTCIEDDVIENQCLRQRLKLDYSLDLPDLPDLEDLEERGARLEYIDSVRSAISANERWQVEDRCALGRFAFPKIAMVKDLDDHTESVISSLLCRTIAGDTSVPPNIAFGDADELPRASQLDDEIEPGEIKTILDCDSSQLEAIVAARKGISFVLDGPPGTGKSQTIANIIADAMGQGRRVLFVSEKIAALEVVKRRLDDCGLGDFCLECHSSKANRKAVLEELQWCLQVPEEVYDDPQPKLTELKRRRDALNSYVRSVHRPRPPLDLTPFQIFGHIARLSKTGLANKSRCPIPDPSTVDKQVLDKWSHVLGRASEVAEVIAAFSSHPWRNCTITSKSLSLKDEILQHFTNLSHAYQEVEKHTHDLVEEGLIQQRPTPRTMVAVVDLLNDSYAAPHVPESWFCNLSGVASAVLIMLEAQEKAALCRSELTAYVSDVHEHFPQKTLKLLNGQGEKSWLSRLKQKPPASVREQSRLLKDLVEDLRSIEHLAERTSLAFEDLVSKLALPISTDIQAAKLIKICELAKRIASNYPLRPGWFVDDVRTNLRSITHEAEKLLESVSPIHAELSSRIGVVDAHGLNSIKRLSDKFESQFATVGPHLLQDTPDALARLRADSRAAESAAKSAIDAIDDLAETLGLQNINSFSIKQARDLASFAAIVQQSGVVHGAWTCETVRAELGAVCSAALENLEDVEDIRDSLANRLSHRAFREEVSGLVSQSKNYRTFYRRLFGKFRAFREAAAELYKAQVPSTKILLEDFDALSRLQRRIQEVKDLAAEHATSLPSNHGEMNSVSWRNLINWLGQYEEFFAEHSEIASMLQKVELQPERQKLQTSITRVVESLNALESSNFKDTLHEVFSYETSLNAQIGKLEEIAKAAEACLHKWEAVAKYYREVPVTISAFQEDQNKIARLLSLLNALTELTKHEKEHLPNEFSANEPKSWERLLSGLDAAEYIASKTKGSSKVIQTVCGEHSLNSKEVANATVGALKSFNEFDRSLTLLSAKVELSLPNVPMTQLGQQSVAAIGELARLAADEFKSRVECLDEIASSIRPDSDVTFQQLALDSQKIRDLEKATKNWHKAERELLASDVAPLGSVDFDARVSAEWILEHASKNRIPELLMAVNRDPRLRDRLKKIRNKLKRVLNPSIEESWKFLQSVLDVSAKAANEISLHDLPVGEVALHLNILCTEIASLDDWLKFSRWRRDMERLGFSQLVSEIIDGEIQPEQASDCILLRFYRKLFDQFVEQDQELGEFDVDEHSKTIERFQRLDAWEVKAAATRIRQFQLSREDRPRPGWYSADSSELGILQREAQKKRRHKPLRRLFAEIPTVLQRLKPCIMMSPLSVSTFLQSKDLTFDLVIFDEASQVFPWDAMGAIYRGAQLIVAGDEKQLPPTNFFNRADADFDSEDEEDDIGDYESILSLCKSIGLPNKRLRWHYRSRREPLIAFSNQHIYSGDLVTFPSVHDASSDSVRFDTVPDGCWHNRRNLPEAKQVVDLLIDHLRCNHNQSIGVIALNVTQQQAIEDELYLRRRENQEIDVLLNHGPSEGLFIKNLENVQGDERDVIILSIGFGKNEAGKPPSRNFGALSRVGGERRLNVAITRARQQVIVVSSIRAAELDLSGISSVGSHLLKSYLEYAEYGVDSLTRNIQTLDSTCESPFEAEVADALMSRGLNVIPQVGCGGFRIDLGISHPLRDGEFCLGVECDGATYHSSHTARDRDRIRQTVLEGLGWRIIRVWSTDWVRDPNRQVSRVLDAYEREIHASPEINNHATVEAEQLDEEFSLEPSLIKADNSQSCSFATFNTIEEVADGTIADSARTILLRMGSTDWDDLVRLIARELGFKRTGSKIRDRIEGVLRSGDCEKTLRRSGDRVMAIG